jgi:molecular chaperone GrpE
MSQHERTPNSGNATSKKTAQQSQPFTPGQTMNSGDTTENGDTVPFDQSQRDSDRSEAIDGVLEDAESQNPDDETATTGDATIDYLQQQVADLTKRELQAAAELENFRKRTYREMEQQIKFAAIPFARDILEVLDNLGRACDAAQADPNAQSLLSGVRMVEKQLVDALAKHKCQPIPALGEVFDPNFHQAISQAPSAEYAAGVVMHEAVVGYQIDERIIRPSQVIVSTGAPE